MLPYEHTHPKVRAHIKNTQISYLLFYVFIILLFICNRTFFWITLQDQSLKYILKFHSPEVIKMSVRNLNLKRMQTPLVKVNEF